MSAKSAVVVSLEEFRRRRASQHAAKPAPVQPVVWCPVWVMVPVWPVPDYGLGLRSLATG